MIPIIAGWEGLIIPMIAFTVWILTVLAKDKQPVAGQNAQRPPVRPGVDLGGELQKFLEEARRRAQKPEPVREARPQPVQRVVQVAPVPAVQEVSRKKRKGQSKPPRPQAAIPFAQAFPDILPEVALVAQPVVEAKPMAEYTEIKMKAKTVAPAVRNAVDLLKDRQSIKTAFILREVLSPPRCKTGPHRI